MNQIINIDLNKNIDKPNDSDINNAFPSQKLSKKKRFNTQFFLSIFAILIILSIFAYYKISLNKAENFSDLLINNYSITQLYSNNTNNITKLEPDSIIGIIKIPNLNISYPIFNELTDELLKISPCRFYGDFPSTNNIDSANMNLCIAGHNYDNDKFFSKIKNLNINDKIFLYDNFNNEYIYSVINNYEVKFTDVSPVYQTISNSYELTLVTCNNYTNNRIIIKAMIEDI